MSVRRYDRWYYAGFSLKEKSSALSRDGGGVGRSASVFGEEKRGIAHETSLSHFLIFCNQLPSKRSRGSEFQSAHVGVGGFAGAG
jgi:hypothetical protein